MSSEPEEFEAEVVEGESLTAYKCSICGWKSSVFLASCNSCGKYSTLAPFLTLVGQESENEENEAGDEEEAEGYAKPRAVNAAKVKFNRHSRVIFGIKGLDDVLGNPISNTYGGVIGSVMWITGDPGVGKSTLVLQATLKAAASGLKVLHADSEEPKENIIDRARRLGAKRDALRNFDIIDDATFIEEVFEEADRLAPDILVVNSLSNYYAHDAMGAPLATECGNPTQLKRLSKIVYTYCHGRNANSKMIMCFGMCHVDKQHGMAGPMALQHACDAQFKMSKTEDFQSSGMVVMETEGNKNRFGNSRLRAQFKMDEAQGFLQFVKMV